MLNFITVPMRYGFMQRGLLEALLVGIICAVIGCYIVLRSMAFLGDAMAHSILPGVAVAYLLKGNIMLGGLVAAVAVALGIGVFSRGGTVKEDTAIGILFAASLALGVALISSMVSYATDLTHILFGNLLGVSPDDLYLTTALAVVILLTIIVLFKEFQVVSFDPVLATTLHLPVSFLRNLMLVLLALTIVISLQTVGVGLVVALLVTPAATALLLTRRLPAMMLVSAACGAVSSVVGLYLSYYVNIASGSAIVLVCTLIFVLAFLFSPRHGVLLHR